MKVHLKVRDIFNKKDVTKAIGVWILGLVTLASIVIFNFYNTALLLEDKSVKIMNNVTNAEGFDAMHICNSINCESVYFQNSNTGLLEVYRNRNGILVQYGAGEIVEPPSFIYHSITTDFNIGLDFEGYMYIINTDYISHASKLFFIFVSILFTITHIILSLIWLVITARDRLISKASVKGELESTLQRNLTEVIHHEMAVPLALIRTLTENYFLEELPCAVNSEKVCQVNKENGLVYTSEGEFFLCAKCDFYKKYKAMDEQRKEEINTKLDIYNDIILNVERLNGILKLLAGSKQIRNNTGNNSIKDIIDNVISSVNCFKLQKVNITYNNPDILSKYTLGLGLNAGAFMNLLQVMVNNAVEAVANNITITAEEINTTMLKLYIKDNGMGIRDSHNRVVNTERIFDYGYTSKANEEDYNTDGSLLKRLWKAFFNRLGINVVQAKNVRGIGLYISRNVLREAGGDLSLTETTSSGTTFCILIPIKAFTA